MRRSRIRASFVPLLIFATVSILAAHEESAHEESLCASNMVSASAIRTTGDVEAFVNCAYEFVMEVGPTEARKAFHEFGRWRSEEYYVFVAGIQPSGEDSIAFVYPPNPSQEGKPWGPLVDNFGTDLISELYRMSMVVDRGWRYYSFGNPATGSEEPKASYHIEIDWMGHRAAIGAGIYPRDAPGTCKPSEVSAAVLESHRTDARLREFVRCAATMIQDQGYAATSELETNSRWSHGSTYVFVLDMMGNQVMTSSKVRINGNAIHEFGSATTPLDRFLGRDIVAVGNTFGEAYVYYEAFNPMTSGLQRKSALLKHVRVQGVPLLVGAGYFLPPDQTADLDQVSCSDHSISAKAIRTTSDVRAFARCAYEYVLEVGPDAAKAAFHEFGRWRYGPYYVFVDSISPDSDGSTAIVFPPNTSYEGQQWGALFGPLVDNFGTDLVGEFERMSAIVDSGWVYYSFGNPATGSDEPKDSYVSVIDWKGTPATIGAGIYRRDILGTCKSSEVNAAALEMDPGDALLLEFVRCAAMRVDAMGLFATQELITSPRWNHGSVYVYGIDIETGVVSLSGNESSYAVSGRIPEVLFGGRDMLAVGATFGEVYWYNNFNNPATGRVEPKVSFLKRVLAHGKPMLVGAGYYPSRQM